MSADPITLGLGGAAIGAMLDSDNPLRGAALGGAGGAIGGAALGGAGAAGAGAAEAAPGMAGALGSGISAPGASANLMAAQGGLGSGLSMGGGTGMAGAGGLLGGQGAGMGAALGSGVGMSTPMLGMTAGEMAPALSMTGQLGKLGSALSDPSVSGRALDMGKQMMMKQNQAQQGQPVMPGIAPPRMMPQFGMPSFMQSAPQFRGVTNLPMNPAMGYGQNRGRM